MGAANSSANSSTSKVVTGMVSHGVTVSPSAPQPVAEAKRNFAFSNNLKGYGDANLANNVEEQPKLYDISDPNNWGSLDDN